MSLRTRCATALQCFHFFALYNLAAHQLIIWDTIMFDGTVQSGLYFGEWKSIRK